MWNTPAFGFDRLSDPLYKSIPFWIGVREGEAHGIFLDAPGRSSIDLGVLDEKSCPSASKTVLWTSTSSPDPTRRR